MRTLQERGVIWVVVQSLLMAGCALSGWFWTGHWPMRQSDWIIGTILAVVGACFGISGISVLRGNRTIFPEPQPQGALIRHGIYRYVRHPLYSSVMFLAFAWACWRRSLPALAVAIALSGFLILKARNEEDRLIRRFPDYMNYRKTTHRFVPWLF